MGFKAITGVYGGDMVQTFATNSNNDIFLAPNGNLSVITGLAAIIAACETASKAQLGEMVLATQNGVPNFQTIWIGQPNYAIFSSYLRNTLENVEGVLQVTDIQMSSKNNILSYTATIQTAFGNGVVNG